MASVGQDIQQVRDLAGQLNAKAGDIQAVLGQLTSQLHSVDWRGNDADRFRGEWDGTHTAQLKAVISALQQASQTAMSNANQQESTSA